MKTRRICGVPHCEKEVPQLGMIYCGRAHYLLDIKRLLREKKSKIPEKFCGICGKVLDKYLNENKLSKHARHKYCSKSCGTTAGNRIRAGDKNKYANGKIVKRQCAKCGEMKPVGDFYQYKGSKNYTPACRKCHKSAMKKKYSVNAALKKIINF